MNAHRTLLNLAIAAALALSVSAQAQEKEQSKSRRTPRLGQTLLMMERVRGALDQLNLTEEQKEKLKTIREAAGPKVKETWEKARSILNEEQVRAAEESLRQARDAGKKGATAVESLLSALKLTDEQKEKMLQIERESLAIQRDLVKQIAEVLTPEQREKFQAALRAGAKRGAKQSTDAKQ